uniref:ATP synthase subunit alpha, chloroplastic n=3 Tax=Lygus hesperus TaxID=30085 RepID=A0A0A9WRV2_LYGHE
MAGVALSMFIVSLLHVGPVFGTESTGWLVEYLTDLSSILKDGYAGAGIPKVDPLPINTNFAIASEIFSGEVALQGQLSGFSNYFVSKAVLNPNLVVELDLIFLSTTFDGSYSLDASLYKNIFPLSGSGPINIYFSFIELSANCTLVGKNEMLQIKDFDFLIKQINAVQVTADGMLKDYGLDQVLAPALKGVLNTVIKVFKSNLENSMNTFVMSNGNIFLRQVTISKVLELIKGLVNNSSHGTITITSASINNLKKNDGLRNVTGESIRKMWELHPQMLLKQTSI